jgi:GTPase
MVDDLNKAGKTDTRCGYVALVGAPNAGKSTLMNSIVGGKVSIVTHKVQTTRALVRGISIYDDTQLIFTDTPGIFAPKRRLDRSMVEAAWSGARDADVVALLIDAKRGLDVQNRAILESIHEVSSTKILILNKIDMVKPERLLSLSEQIHALCPFEQTFMLSALHHEGVGDLVAWLAKRMPIGPWLYDADQMSDLPLRQLAAEITREKMLLRVHDELPYEATVETESWKDQKDGSVRVEQVLYVMRDGQKKIVLGEGGRTIKAISMQARQELEAILEQRVHLFLFVKVRENWMDDPERYQNMGLDFKK